MFGPVTPRTQGYDLLLAGHALRYDPGTYEVTEAPRFGQKINVGSLKYADFNPFDSAHAIATLTGGYGLAAYSDLPDGELAATMYDDASNVDARQSPITLSDLVTVETLTGSTAPAVWVGEFLGQWVAVAGTKVYTRSGGGTWSSTGITLPAAARQNAIGVFGGNLVIGFGAAATAKYTANLSTIGDVQEDTVNMYVFAFTADQAASYVAGGTATTNVNRVVASTDGIAYAGASAVVCGTVDHPIVTLAPGGGVVIVMVGKSTELGYIDLSATYRIAIPYDSALATNSSPMRWALADAKAEAQGPVSVFFGRERSIWNFQPSSQTAGRAANVSPWADPNLHPTTARGIFTAFQGSARWLYAAIKDDDGHVWIVCLDQRTGRWHIYLDIGVHDCKVLGITSLFGTNPLLFIGYGNNIASVILPLDGDNPLEDPERQYAATGSLTLSDIDLGFPDEDKVAFSIRINARNTLAGHRGITVYANFDGGSYEQIGVVDTNEFIDIDFSPDIVCKRTKLRLDFFTDDPNETPELHGLTVRLSLNTTLRRLWTFVANVPAGFRANGKDFENPQTVVDDLWEARRIGVSVPYTDHWAHNYNVRILQLDEKEVYHDPDRTLETKMQVTLLEVGEGADVSIIFTAPPAAHTFLPITLGDP